jgi:hypothetical protein
LDDAAVKDDQTFFLTLSGRTGGTSLADGGTAMVKILANPTSIPPDTTTPEITGAPDRPPDADGWYNATVWVAFRQVTHHFRPPHFSAGTPTM